MKIIIAEQLFDRVFKPTASMCASAFGKYDIKKKKGKSTEETKADFMYQALKEAFIEGARVGYRMGYEIGASE